jgi:MFS family permease
MNSVAKPTSSIFETSDDRVSGGDLRVSMTRVIMAWGFGAVYMNTIGGAIYTVFVRSLSTDDFLYGLLAAALPFMSILQVISARVIERTGHRKRQMMVNQLIGRFLWLMAALLPLLWVYFPERFSKSGIFYMVMICVASSGVFQALAGPAFFSWMADLIPDRVRPTFFARRMQVGTLASCCAALLGGLVADNFGSLPVYCAVLALAAVAGLIDTAMFFGVKEPTASIPANRESAEPGEQLSFFASIREPLREPAVRSFLLFVSALFVGYGLQGPYLWLHSLEYLKLSKTGTGFIVNIAPLLGIAWSLVFWKGAVKKYGTRPIMRLSSFGLIFIPAGWFFSQPDSWFTVALFTCVSGMLAGAIDLCMQTLVTGIAPNVPRPTLAALFSIAAGCSFALASIFSGWIARYLQGMHVELWGHTLINYHVLFLCAILMRIINAFFIAPRLQEPDSLSTLETVKEIIPELAQSFADLLTRPISRKAEN